jgi:hypothetical protein
MPQEHTNMQEKPISWWVPRWAADALAKSQCPKCERPVDKKDVVALGVRDASGKNVFFVEYVCAGCGNRAVHMFRLPEPKDATLEDMCFFLLRSIRQLKALETSQHLQNDTPDHGRITDEEFEQFRQWLVHVDHDEFMKAIGADKIEPVDLPDKRKPEDKGSEDAG